MTIRSMSRVILQHLKEIRQRLIDQDESLQDVCLWPETKPMISSTYISMFLEESNIGKALQECLKACAASPIVKTLHLRNLPEPDLEAALLTLAKNHGPLNLRELHIAPLHASSSISGKVLTKFMQTLAGSPLQVLDCPTRIRLPHQAAVEALAQSLRQLPNLVRLRLHVVPRTSIETPTVRLDALVRVACDWETLELIAGYPGHNPYQKPMIHTQTCAQLMQRNPAICVLTLANLGLTSSHVRALVQGPWPALLEHLSLPYNPRLANNQWGPILAEKLQNPQHTTLEAVRVPRPCLAVDVWTTLNHLGRSELVQATEGSMEHRKIWQEIMLNAQEVADETLRLNLSFALIRQNPTLAVQTLLA